MELPKRRIVMNAFFKAQFNYCPAIWLFHSCTLNNKINRLLELCVRIIYNDNVSNFAELLYALAIETCKVLNVCLQK